MGDQLLVLRGHVLRRDNFFETIPDSLSLDVLYEDALDVCALVVALVNHLLDFGELLSREADSFEVLLQAGDVARVLQVIL